MKPQRKQNYGDRIYNPAGFGKWKLRKQMEQRIDEVRVWSLECSSCHHIGVVSITLRKLRTANLVCSACGKPRRRE